jgi:hypothetical protein
MGEVVVAVAECKDVVVVLVVVVIHWVDTLCSTTRRRECFVGNTWVDLPVEERDPGNVDEEKASADSVKNNNSVVVIHHNINKTHRCRRMEQGMMVCGQLVDRWIERCGAELLSQ